MATPQKQYVPLNQAAQGGIVDDIDVTILDAAFVEWNYNNKINPETGKEYPFELALGIQFQDDNGKTYDQYYSAGKLEFFVPTDDGAGIVPVADKQLLNDNTNAMKFLMSLLEVGFPEETLASGNVKELVGAKIHVKQHEQPVRQGLIRGGGNKRPATVLLASALISLPGQGEEAPAKKGVAGKGTPVGAKTPAAKPAAAAPAKAAASAAVKPNGKAAPASTASGDDETAIALDILNGILIEHDGNVTKKDLSKLAFQAAGARVTAGGLDPKSKTKVCQTIFQDAMLHAWANDGLIAYDGTTVSLPQ